MMLNYLHSELRMYKKLLIRVLMSHEIRFKYLENHSAFGLLLRALAPVIIVPTYLRVLNDFTRASCT